MDTTSKYQKVKLFYETHNINVQKLKQFALKMKKTIDLRNQCAHPDIHNKSFAIKARNVTYKHSADDETVISPIKIAIDIYELIFAIGDIFE
jgi:ABC-type siderophore export system fused ATPase/permease subunit